MSTVSPFSTTPEQKASAQTQSSVTLSSPLRVDLVIYRGDSGAFQITVTGADGSPVDLTGATFDADIRVKATDPTLITTFDVSQNASSINTVDVSLPPDKSDLITGPCVYDVEMRKDEEVMTLIYGSISVTQDVSRP